MRLCASQRKDIQERGVMKTLGGIRSVNCTEAVISLATGVILTFRIGIEHRSLRHCIEVNRTRRFAKPRESILVDAHTLQLARSTALDVILKHRKRMQLSEPVKVAQRFAQLQFRFT